MGFEHRVNNPRSASMQMPVHAPIGNVGSTMTLYCIRLKHEHCQVKRQRQLLYVPVLEQQGDNAIIHVSLERVWTNFQ